MADRRSRSVRAASRRKTPTPQLSTTPQPARASRARGVQSVHGDVGATYEAAKPTRRSARQASLTTMTDESENEGQPTRRAARKLAKEAIPDLTVVDEVDTQVEIEQVSATPRRASIEHPVPFPSPGAVSEMSGTTAISSFSMIEAEFLEPKFVLKHLRKLCEAAQEFLEHLAPDAGNMQADLHNIHQLQKPESDFAEEYRDFNDELNVHLKHFKSEEHGYIHVGAIHRVLFPVNPDLCAAESGLDPILYMANLLVFAKDMIPSDREDKQIWDALRRLDNYFPSHFMRSLDSETGSTAAGDSAMLMDTFQLALELRTQLAILVLQKSASDSDFNPEEAIHEVFYRSGMSQENETAFLRGWNTVALGGDETALPQPFENHVEERLAKIREFFLSNDELSERGDVLDFDGLSRFFPWQATVLRLVEWVRYRHRELFITIEQLGGPVTIVRNVKQLIENPIITDGLSAASRQTAVARGSRSSFVRDRRRSNRRFDPNAPVDMDAIDILKARERLSQASTALQGAAPEDVEDELPNIPSQVVGHQPAAIVGEEEERQDESLGEEANDERVEEAVVSIEEPLQEEDLEENEIEPEPSAPPTSLAALLKAVKAAKPQQENRTTSIFDRQAGAQQIEFGDGFDTQSSPGPCTRDKGKQRAQQSPNRKRQRAVEAESDSEDDAFEREDRTARVQERRQKARVAKKVRIDPSSSGAPTSHQPRPRPEVVDDNDNDYIVRLPRQKAAQDESISEGEAPDMTEEAPPSTYRAQVKLAKQNLAGFGPAQRTERKARTQWSAEEEDVFAEYMAMFPAQYSAILTHDKALGRGVLQERTQVNLKDKARTMAINMIKSGTGLMPGFEDIVRPSSAHGKALCAQGFTW
ncbi:hypothetical protein ACEQ8H_001429 [Pleosporales sp. CAS-2024a]